MANYLFARLGRGLLAGTRRLTLPSLALLLSACSEPQPAALLPTTLNMVQINTSLQALETLWLEQRRALMINVEALRLSTQAFLQMPDQQHQQAAQAAWLKAHTAFAALIALPLADPLDPMLYQLDAWPIEPGYLDTLPAYPGSGLISDLTVTITPESLREQHGFTDSAEVSLGFHAFEYLLFERPTADFVAAAPVAPTDANEIIVRRRLVLDMLAEQINSDLHQWLLQAEFNFGLAPAEAELSDPTSQVTRLLAHSQQIAKLAMTEANQQLIPGRGHGTYSQSARSSLQYKLAGLNQVFFSPVGLGNSLSPLDAAAVEDLERTLQEATDLSALAQISDTQETRLGLLLLILPDQLAGLSKALTQAVHPLPQ